MTGCLSTALFLTRLFFGQSQVTIAGNSAGMGGIQRAKAMAIYSMCRDIESLKGEATDEVPRL